MKNADRRLPREELEAILRDTVKNTPSAELPELIGQLEAMKFAAFARLLMPAESPRPVPDQDRLVTAKRAAEILGMTERWVREHQSELPRVVLPGRALRFSEKRLRSKIARAGA